MLEVRQLTFAYPEQSEPWCFDFQVPPGQCLAITGASGAGKSTLLSLLAGFLRPASGSIRWRGEALESLPPAERPVTSVFQEHNLFEHLDVHTNIALGLHPGKKLSAGQHREIDAGLARVGLPGFGKRMPGELSGGQRQRVALLRSTLRKQPLLLLDEPLTGLDDQAQAVMRTLLLEQKAAGVTLILASHHEEDRQVLADRNWNL
ncbi:ATP-binding cassette domain-containing protein [Marinobacter sp. X15-166B]|uniref:thiamine ABC transporter ATP-binding protein n=1 Tax=Marinobacter sp. X15-166B TaxID=1897620 RepID=UPI00085C4F8F|nr:ATP-binding cassette domain-containing protein [Marinobacter sp. X15-166B]OEY67428.1 ABC transporter [Marinobacter sp. X15-166B]